MHPPHVLVVDDAPEIRALYQLALEEEGYRVTSYPTPKADLAAVSDLAPDVIVLELIFDGVPLGLPALETLKRDAATAAIPAIVCTAAPELAGQAQAALAALDAPVLLKPFDLTDLFGTIDRCLAGDAPVAAAADETTST